MMSGLVSTTRYQTLSCGGSVRTFSYTVKMLNSSSFSFCLDAWKHRRVLLLISSLFVICCCCVVVIFVFTFFS